ncbi:hypothetical protein CLU79DRAFT_844731 [Phycomyces nitens]|nr:hypothetical protein CLU79DRAFT_844731 [Phycomyces nitens]
MYDVSKLPRRSNSNFCGPERTFQIPGFKYQDKAGQPIHKTGWNNSRTILSLGAVYILLGLGQSTKRLNQGKSQMVTLTTIVKSHTILAMEMVVAVQAKDASKQQTAKSKSKQQKQTAKAKTQKPKPKTKYSNHVELPLHCQSVQPAKIPRRNNHKITEIEMKKAAQSLAISLGCGKGIPGPQQESKPSTKHPIHQEIQYRTSGKSGFSYPGLCTTRGHHLEDASESEEWVLLTAGR